MQITRVISIHRDLMNEMWKMGGLSAGVDCSQNVDDEWKGNVLVLVFEEFTIRMPDAGIELTDMEYKRQTSSLLEPPVV